MRNLASSPRASARFDELPADLIIEIAEWLYQDSLLTPPLYCIRFSALKSPIMVNRRIRELISPVARRDLYFRERKDYLQFVKDHQGDDRMRSVRRIRIGSNIAQKQLRNLRQLLDSDKTVTEIPDIQVAFDRLDHFECISMYCNKRTLLQLEQNKSLRTIHMSWHTLDHFPSMERFPSVSTLRLFTKIGHSSHVDIDTPHWAYDINMRHLPAYSSITTLQLTGFFPSSRFYIECMQGLRFPNLRVLHLSSVAEPLPIFQFVHMHPTIMEVNISIAAPAYSITSAEATRFVALLELIHGTGTWKHPYRRFGCNPDYRVVHIREMDASEALIYPQHVGCNIKFHQFAFSRVPCADDATTWALPVGSIHRRYKCTGIALRVLPPDLDPDVPDFEATMKVISERLSGVHELRISCEDVEVNESNFTRRMGSIGTCSQNLTSLRKLAVHWSLPAVGYDWVWGLPNHVGTQCEPDEEEARPTNYNLGVDVWGEFNRRSQRTNKEYKRSPSLYLNDVDPPIARWAITKWQQGRAQKVPTFSLNDLSYAGIHHEYEVDDLEAAIRDVLRYEKDEPLDRDDKNLIMRAWQANNELTVARLVRHLATKYPMLEEFEWWPKDALSKAACSVRWTWKIIRGRTTGDKAAGDSLASQEPWHVKSVIGNLTWPGCLQGTPPPMYMLVGEELQRVYEEPGVFSPA